MDFRIADTFTDSLARLTGDEQKAAKTTAFDLQVNPASPGLQFHKLDRAKDKNFWSMRVNADIRIIVHRSGEGLLLCYVDHHDKAYRWAESRKLVTHPKTGAAQMVEIRETVQEIIIPKYVDVDQPVPSKPKLFEQFSADELLTYGVPEEWMQDVRQANEDSLLTLADHLPREAAEALLEIATGGKPRVVQSLPTGGDPFAHPDAQRRFRILKDVDELQRALDFPWDKWTVFLHPAQREVITHEYSGPARISGSAGTGKTIVALHRAVQLARTNQDTRVLLTSFSEILANALNVKLRRLISNEPRLADRIDVVALASIGRRLYKTYFGEPNLALPADIARLLQAASRSEASKKFSQAFLVSEWEHVVDAWQIDSWEGYRDVKRLGRKTRLSENQRKALWDIFQQVKTAVGTARAITESEMFTKLASAISGAKNRLFDFAIVDEAQDLGVGHLRFLAALAGGRSNGLFFAGDLGQRIFQQPFSWKALGIDVRGRSRTLNVNYRTSHQIRSQADRLLTYEITDVDGNSEARGNSISVFNGDPPQVVPCQDEDTEIKYVAAWLKGLGDAGVQPHEIGIFVRAAVQVDRAVEAAKAAGLPFRVLDVRVEAISGQAAISTMHLAKGLEFRAVAVMACDDEVIPLQERIEAVTDESDLKDVYDTERHLLYVACTRARDFLLVTSGFHPSEFLEDLCNSSPKKNA